MNRLRAHTGPLWPYLVLVAIPAAAFILPDLFGGHLLVTGDNVQQNYPLHVLVGSMLAHGHLPFWNPYIFSGTPLLAGFNAGAFYPLVGLFVILPDRVAWIVLEVVLFSLIAIGMYAYLRALALSTMACFLAAGTSSFAGVVLSQANHVDMTEGFVAIPWMLLAIVHILRHGRWRWSILLGIGLAVVILGGAPEAMLDGAILIVAYAAISAGVNRQRWWRVISRVSAGAALGLSLSAMQWLPGLNAIANSQRSGFGGGFASTGSFPPKDAVLAVVPYLYGGFGRLGEARFFSRYNLPEVGIYLGILPIVALLVLLHPSWPSRLPARERRSWYLIGLLGLLLALGANTPLEHVFNSIPFYGQQRLQSRNMIDVAVAICVLFAGWIDRETGAGATLVRFERWMGLVPAGLVLGLMTWALADPDQLITRLARATPTAREVHTVRVSTFIALAFCTVAAVVVWLRPRLPARWWMTAVAVFVAADVGLMAGTSELTELPSNAMLAGRTTVERFIAAHLAPAGRFDVFDPLGYSTGPPGTTGTDGFPDDNILAGLPSVGGYASLVNGGYDTLTETHSRGDLNVRSLGAGMLDDLDLEDLLTLPQYFLVPLSKVPHSLHGTHPISEAVDQDPVLPLGFGSGDGHPDADYATYPVPRGALQAGQSDTWFFGRSLAPPQATLLFTSASGAAVVRFGLLHRTRPTTWGPATLVGQGARGLVDPLPGDAGVGLVVQVIFGQLPRHQAFISLDRRVYELDGSLSSAVRPGPWQLQGNPGGYSLMVRTRPPAPVRVVAAGSASSAQIAIVSSDANVQSVRVEAPSELSVVRSVAWDAGWEATLSVNGGAPQRLAVAREGLVQRVRVPQGSDLITFRYRPPHLIVAAWLTGASAVFLLALLIGTLWRLAFRRPAGSRPE